MLQNKIDLTILLRIFPSPHDLLCIEIILDQAIPGGIWFRVNVGRRHNADPRWMVPLICRRGQVQKAAIGQIRIFNKDSHFEIHPSFAADFEAAAAMPDRKEPGVLIERV